MEAPVLKDEHIYPSDDVLEQHLQGAKPIWDAFTARLTTELPDASLEWRYYQDGKSWLCRLVRRKKTICWLSIWDQFFKTTFYFTAKCDHDIEGLPIGQAFKNAYRALPLKGKLKPITIEVRSTKALGDVLTLARYKSASK